MDDVFSPIVTRWLLLAVLAAPLAFAAVLAVGGGTARVARRLAGMCAVLHLGLTAFVVAPAAIALAQYEEMNEGRPHYKFRPVAVPGDTGEASSGQEHKTSWNLLFVGKAVGWAPPPAVQFYIGLDGINVWLVALTSLMTYIAVAVSWGFAQDRAGAYYAWLFVLQAAVTGAFLSFDVILFYVFFELTLIPTFFLIGGWGVGGGKRDAARKFFLYTLFGGLLSLVGLVGIVLTNPTLDATKFTPGQSRQLPARGPVSFNVNQLMLNVGNWHVAHDSVVSALSDPSTAKPAGPDGQADDKLAAAKAARDGYKTTQFWLFFLLVAGFVVKVPLVPFHTWLPAAYAEAPPAVTLMLSALLAKLGTLGMLRIVIPLCPHMAVEYGLAVFGTLGAVGVVYAAFCAYAQKDVKLMAAYSSVSHLGLLAVGLFALNTEGLTGAVLHMVNHGLTAGGLFAVVAILYDRYRTTDMTHMGGLMARHPRLAFFTFVLCLAGVGLPGLNSFVSEMMLIGALFTPWNTAAMGYGLAVAAAAGIFLSAWYTFTMLRTVFFGPARTPPRADGTPAPTDLTGRETLALGLIAVLCLALGLYPQPVIDVVKGDVAVVAQALKNARWSVNRELADAEDRPAVTVQQPISVNPTLIPAGAGRGGPPAGGPGGPPRPPQQPPR